MPQQEAPTQLKIDETAQIVISQPDKGGVVLRFKDEKKAKETFKRLETKWKTASIGAADKIIKIDADMFDCIVDLSTVLHMSLVIHKVAGKFVPWRG